VTAIPLGRRLPGASSNLPERPDPDTIPKRFVLARKAFAPSLFGLAPGGVCHAADVTAGAVRSYRTVSPLPRLVTQRAAAVCSLWHCPWARTRRTLSGTACPWSPDFPPRQPFGFAGAAVRPTDRTGMGRPALFVKRRGRSQCYGPVTRWCAPGHAWRSGSATSPVSTRHRRRRPAADGNGAGTP